MRKCSLLIIIVCWLISAPLSIFAADSADIVAFAKPAVVFVRHRDESGNQTCGTGFLINKSGLIVTCAHVVEPKLCSSKLRVKDKIWVKFSDGSTKEAIRTSCDNLSDIAVIKANVTDYPYLDLETKQPQQGEDVITLGYPLGKLLGTELAVTRGVISAIRFGGSAYQLDAAINPGNSGGPVLNKNGDVVGVISFKLRDTEGINFAVAASCLTSIIEIPKLPDSLNADDVQTQVVRKALKIIHEDQNSKTPLHRAVLAHDIELAKKLIADRCNINAKTVHGTTPLEDAVLTRQLDMVKVLLDGGADATATDKRGSTALHKAAKWGHSDIIELLIKYGAKVNARDSFGTTPLGEALSMQSVDTTGCWIEAVELLRRHGATR